MKRAGLLAALLLGRGAPSGERAGWRRRRTGLDDARADNGDGQSLQCPEGTVVHRDLAYGAGPAQRLDVYCPAAARGAPVVLFVHGGGWRNGDKAMHRMVANKALHWLAKGCVFVSTNYRMLPDADVLTQADDVARALAFVQANALVWGADAARVVLMGHSAGAHLVALLAADGDIVRRQGARGGLATVALDSAALDMVAIMNRPHYRFYDPVFGDDPAFWEQASPMHRLRVAPEAPMLLVCSALREDAEPPARALADKASRLGGRAQVLPVALNHREVNEQLGLPGDYTTAVDAFLKTVGLP